MKYSLRTSSAIDNMYCGVQVSLRVQYGSTSLTHPHKTKEAHTPVRSSRRYFPGGLLQERVAWGYWATSLSVNRDWSGLEYQNMTSPGAVYWYSSLAWEYSWFHLQLSFLCCVWNCVSRRTANCAYSVQILYKFLWAYGRPWHHMAPLGLKGYICLIPVFTEQ